MDERQAVIMKLKKVFCIFIAIAMVLMVVACGGEGSNNSGGSNNNSGDSGTSGDGQDSGGDNTSGGDTSGGDTSGGDSSGSGGDSVNSGNSGSGSSGGNSALSGSASEVLAQLVEDLQNAGVDMPMTFPGPPPEVGPELAHNYIGLSEDDFLRLAISAAYSEAAIGTFAHQINIIQAKDASAAAEVKKLISGNDGFDPQKWICVWPERVSAVDSGSYVLLVAARIFVVEAAIDIFRDTSGSIGEVITFWEFTGD